uniref:testis-expressed protein 52-like n=1 Tax=Pristiophorus japonicus TaxID=55135 RepID=UPI00398EA386
MDPQSWKIQQPCWERPDRHSMPVSKLLTRANREYLFEDKRARFTGFLSRAEQRLALQPPPHGDVMAEFFQRLQASLQRHFPSLKHHDWLDVGKFTPIFSNRPETKSNSNIWRCYVSRDSEHHSNIDQARVSKLIAALYPITIPPPSRMGENTWLQFVSNGNLYIDLQGKKKAITLLEKEQEHNRKLKIKSESRVPPIDCHGNILPPEHIKGHPASTPCLPPGCTIPDAKDSTATTCNIKHQRAVLDTIFLCNCIVETLIIAEHGLLDIQKCFQMRRSLSSKKKAAKTCKGCKRVKGALQHVVLQKPITIPGTHKGVVYKAAAFQQGDSHVPVPPVTARIGAQHQGLWQ